MSLRQVLPQSQPASYVPDSLDPLVSERLTMLDVEELLRSSFDAQRESQEPDEGQRRIPSTHNARVYLAGTSASIRVVLERYPDGVVLASLVGDPSVCAVGDRIEAAIRELIHFMDTGLAELSTYREEELTEGPRKRREMLRRLLGGAAR